MRVTIRTASHINFNPPPLALTTLTYLISTYSIFVFPVALVPSLSSLSLPHHHHHHHPYTPLKSQTQSSSSPSPRGQPHSTAQHYRLSPPTPSIPPAKQTRRLGSPPSPHTPPTSLELSHALVSSLATIHRPPFRVPPYRRPRALSTPPPPTSTSRSPEQQQL
ncbi:hypothetical protein PLEOSDRAFT_1110059 [Pleurotus ostreatus PC15]|uniref:Uncharacterized protein n=1 Tax=Pleurotus ostreatus (strain PC15) TaxID=1137138 RepID=A0A067N7M7_PLEO1|nr:hypothetical protein PLEOSDRAFT_1110059 [Pleurotus ostreatus PC15]